jgi:hypothetical protein
MATDGTAYGYGQMYDPLTFRQTPFNGYGAQGYGNPTRGNGQGRNRGGRDVRNGLSNGNGGGGYRAQQAPQQFNQAFINPAFPVSPFQSSSGSQVDVQESVEDGSDVIGMAGYPDGQGYHAMSGVVLPGEHSGSPSDHCWPVFAQECRRWWRVRKHPKHIHRITAAGSRIQCPVSGSIRIVISDTEGNYQASTGTWVPLDLSSVRVLI